MTDDDLDLENALEPRPAWALTDVHAVPDGVWRVAFEAAAEAARRERITLDLSEFEPAAAARLDLEGRSMGQVVMTIRRWRGVASVRLGGSPALLVAELDVVDEEAADAAVQGNGIRLSIVPFADAAEAARIAQQDEPGYRM